MRENWKHTVLKKRKFLSRFFFDHRGAKKKLCKKKTPN